MRVPMGKARVCAIRKTCRFESCLGLFFILYQTGATGIGLLTQALRFNSERLHEFNKEDKMVEIKKITKDSKYVTVYGEKDNGKKTKVRISRKTAIAKEILSKGRFSLLNNFDKQKIISSLNHHGSLIVHRKS